MQIATQTNMALDETTSTYGSSNAEDESTTTREDVFEAGLENFEGEEDMQIDSAIEDDDDDDCAWEDEEEQTTQSHAQEADWYRRVDLKLKPALRRSLLTTMMRSTQQQHAARRTTPEVQKPRTRSPDGPLSSHPVTIEPASMMMVEVIRSRPVMMAPTDVNSSAPVLSPRSTRHNMLSTELTESLRKHLLWDRQVIRSATNTSRKRRHTTGDMFKPQRFRDENAYTQGSNSQVMEYLNHGLQEYHQKGW